jgi:hypothetical protein
MSNTADESDTVGTDSNDARAPQRTRQHTTTRTNAIVVVDTGNTTRTARLLDLLADYADDPEAFERLGTMKVGDTLAVDGGRTSVSRVR